LLPIVKVLHKNRLRLRQCHSVICYCALTRFSVPILSNTHISLLASYPVAPHLTVVTSTSAQSAVAVPVPDALAASVVPSETAVHETTGVRASSSNGR